MSKEVKMGRYKHYKKGDLYQVVGTALHSETREPLVVYVALRKGADQLLAMPRQMFNDEVEVDGKIVPRFKPI